MSKTLVTGILWSVLEVIIKRVLDLIVKLVLARILFPEDFGVVGMATVFISFIQVLNEAGMGAALIQKKESEFSSEHLNTVFWTNLIWSIFLYIIIFLASPYIADFYNTEILVKVIPILSLTILFSAFNVVHKSQLMRDLKFKKLAFVNNISTLIAGIVALVLAYLDFGIWALILNTILISLISVPLFYYQTKWKPKSKFEYKYLKEILSFGIFTTFTQIIINVVSNADYLLIGKFVTPAAVGVYSLAYMMTSLVKAQVTSMLNRVMFPFYSKIQDDISLLSKYYLQTVKYYAIILFPIMVFIIVLGEEIINIFYGQKWIATVLPMKILAIGMMISVLTNGYNLLFRSIGNAKIELKVQIITSLLIYLPCITIGIYLNGYIGVAWGVVVSTLINFIIAQILLDKHFNLRFKDLYKNILPVFIASFVSLGLGYFLKFLEVHSILIAFLLILIYLIIYFIFYKNEVQMIRKKLKK